MQDTINLSYNLQLLGEVYLQLKQYDEASKCLNQALEATPSSHIAKVHLADIEYEKGNIPAALNLIENMADSVDHNERPYAVATAALIYSKAGLIDSVYHLAKQLIQQKGNGHIGYYLLTKEEMKDFVKPDSLYRYIQGYVAHTEKYMDNIVREKIILQETSYNYQKHERDKNRLLEENLKLKNKLIGCIAVISVLMIVVLLASLYKTQSKLTLSRVLDNIRQIRIGQESLSPENALSLEKNNSESELKASLLKNLEDLAETNRFHLSESFLHSDTYDILQNLISTQKPIPENSELWSEIEKQINEWSPNFKKNLDILTDGKLKQTDYAIAVLIKCGFNTSQMGILLSRAKNTISTRKDSLSKKLFKEKRPSKDLETLIHSI